MSAYDIPEIGETEARCLDILANVFDALVDDLIEQKQYSGPDAPMHAKNQVERELVDVLTTLVRASRQADE